MKFIFKKKEKIILKGYLKYKRNKNINIFNNIKNKIIDTDINLSKKSILKKYFRDPQISIKQYLINDLLLNTSNSFKLKLYYSNIKNIFNFPLPPEWRNIIRGFNVKINNFSLNFYWSIYVFKKSLFGMLIAINLLFIQKKNQATKKNFVILSEVYPESLPFEDGKNALFNFFENYENKLIGLNYNSYYNNNKLFYYDIFKNINFINRFIIFLKFFKFFFHSLINLNSHDLIMSGEVIKLFIVDMIEYEKCPKKIYVPSSNYLYKPLWIQRLEDKFSIENSMFFYSTSFIDENFKNSEQLKILSWKNLITFDLFFKKKLINYNKKFNINLCNQFSLYDKDIISVDSKNNNNLAIFDHQCFSNIDYLKYMNVGVDSEIFRPKIIIEFLSDIIDLALKNNVNIYYKTKIYENNFMNKNYLKLIKSYEKNKNFNKVDVYTSPITLIDKIDKIISMPLSTINSFLNTSKKKYLIYYPCISKKNYFSNNKQICFDKLILEKFIKS